MRRFKRIFTIVIDSLGVGAMPDSSRYGDVGVNTFLHVWNVSEGLKIPHLRRLGLGNLCGVSTDRVRGYFLDLYEASAGKDTRTGHWEMMGIHVTEPSRDVRKKTALDVLKEHGLEVIGVGRISRIFGGRGITRAYESGSSVQGMEQTIEIAEEDFRGLCYVNLADFDDLWGHRRNPVGYGRELEAFDEKLGELLKRLKEDDLLMITADHGNDPTYVGTDHTRERVPLLIYSPLMKEGGRLASEDTFGVVGCTIVDNFGLHMPSGAIGYSMMPSIVF